MSSVVKMSINIWSPRQNEGGRIETLAKVHHRGTNVAICKCVLG